jgi:hypothetical protein
VRGRAFLLLLAITVCGLRMMVSCVVMVLIIVFVIVGGLVVGSVD